MPSLQVRELPESIYRKLLELARIEHRSIAQQAIVALTKGLGFENSAKDRRSELIKKLRSKPTSTFSDPTKLISKDRQR